MKKFSFLIFILLCFPLPLLPTENKSIDPKDIGITEHLGTKVSLDTPFVDETGKQVLLGDFFKDGKPVILTLVYYECPDLCTFLLNGLLGTLNKISWTPGNEFTIVSVSINPKDTPELASAKKKAYLEKLGKPDAGKGWHFLTGTEVNIKKLAGEVGFGYQYNVLQKQYAHTAVLFVLMPDGKISRYLHGTQFKPLDLKLALLEASEGKIGKMFRFFRGLL